MVCRSHFSPYGNDYPLWGRLIRCSPPSKQLLRELDEFVPPWNLFPSSDHARYCLCPSEFHDVVQWLKVNSRPFNAIIYLLSTYWQVLSDPPLELIERWKGYLSKSRDICLRLKLKTCTDEELERNWQKDLCTSTNTAWPFDEDVLF
jgi:hypothetical protein